ncbi:MAG: PQQ-binding-like beta-propeller repeat protein [Planctomycetota bacterium]
MRANLAPLLLGTIALLASCSVASRGWPAAGGPRGHWTADDRSAPAQWSVVRDENIAWRVPLPESGQSGICVAQDRVFVTTLAVFDPGSAEHPARRFSKDIVGLCFDARSGRQLWSVDVPGVVESPNMYAYSDSSSPTPCTDGRHVFFVNASGGIACCDFAGHVVWRRTWRPWSIDDGFPFNKQFEPFVHGGALVNLEPRDAEDPLAKKGWNFLHGLDADSGATRWIAEDGTTAYCTPVIGTTSEGRAAVLHGRGGWHGVPEEPVGLSLTDLERDDAGRTLWRYVASTDHDGDPLAKPGTLHAPTWQALYVQHWDQGRAYWFVHDPIESHLVIDAHDGHEIARQSLVDPVDLRRFDAATGRYEALLGIDLRGYADPSPRMHFDAQKDVVVVHPAWHGNIVTHGWHWFLCSTAHGRNAAPNRTRPDRRGVAGPSHCLGRVNVVTGKVEYLELPVNVVRSKGEPDRLVWGTAQRTKAEDSRGIDIADEDRSRTDGWEIPAFWASPTAIGDVIYFTTTLGLVYAIDAKAAVLDEHALLAVNDLGPLGETWAMGNLASDGPRLFFRTAKELICVGR